MKGYRHYRKQGWPRRLAVAMVCDCTTPWAIRHRYPVPEKT